MRKVTAGLFHSVDGVVQDPFKFQFDSFDDELGTGLTKMINTVDTVVLGRVSYQEWAAIGPTRRGTKTLLPSSTLWKSSLHPAPCPNPLNGKIPT